jgi:GNAT superfamily N-acetyltransferase
VLRESIEKLCYADHENDAATLKLWLENKTPDNFLQWLSNPGSTVIVARIGGRVRGVGAVHTTAGMLMCYVQPGFERQGMGRAMLDALEAQARSWGVERLLTHSSLTAQAFYERHGYVPDGDPVPAFGVAKGYPYAKRLAK